MARWSGKVGFAIPIETVPGVTEETFVERTYYGDLDRNMRTLQGNGVNDDINISNEISIVADPYAKENFHYIRYVIFMGTKWKVNSITVRYPRLVMSLGGVYNA